MSSNLDAYDRSNRSCRLHHAGDFCASCLRCCDPARLGVIAQLVLPADMPWFWDLIYEQWRTLLLLRRRRPSTAELWDELKIYQIFWDLGKVFIDRLPETVYTHEYLEWHAVHLIRDTGRKRIMLRHYRRTSGHLKRKNQLYLASLESVDGHDTPARQRVANPPAG